MFEALDAIPVTFGPHAGDVWMIAATLLSFATSLVVAVVAARNGQKATKIAKDASDRDEQYRISEGARRDRDARAAVALAMIRAVNAVETTSTKDPESRDSAGRSFGPSAVAASARQEEDMRINEALALISLFASDEHQIRFRRWFHHMIRHMRGFSVYSSAEGYEEARNELLARIAGWNADPTSLRQMLSLDFKGKLGRGKDLETCNADQSLPDD
ncbi:hypothetical protein [Leucobacter aridicollis]|uniref:hypothetical protein n=1 Tax=Leucobacter aridicollis TaxID=283878 RepID=UPI002166DF4C|nr:hypothetical protein [Leucobacter aridicollis]MCS3426716.1 hypothetical protein [Leucobacter aridicollis]